MTEQEWAMGVIDSAALDNLREMIGGDEAFLEELIETFLTDSPKMLADMRQSIEDEDAAALCLAAHSLKSNSTEFGAVTLSSLCRDLEKACKAGSLTGAAEKVAHIEMEYARVKAALEELQSS